MNRLDLADEYFDWMYKKVLGNNKTYRNLLRFLDSVEFRYTIEKDGNRAADGVSLRYLFGLDKKYPDSMIATMLDDHEPSVLEMMVALANRVEQNLMTDFTKGDRTGVWFFAMIDSLGLTAQVDSNFDYDFCRRAINRFMTHSYNKNGKGGLFTIHDSNKDMRQEEIWCQLMWYLNEHVDTSDYLK